MDVVLLLGAAGIGALLYKGLRQRQSAIHLELEDSFEVACHVAVHEAKVRGRALQPVDLLYGLVLEEDFRTAAARLGADVDAIERCVFDALSAAGEGDGGMDEVRRQLTASALPGRRARFVDLWNALFKHEPLTKKACAAGGIEAIDLLFVLAHGYAEKELRPPSEGDAAVVLLNDDFTTMEMVSAILEEHFGLEPDAARTLMLRVHQAGSATVGRYGLAEAKERTAKALATARTRGYPLAIRLDA